MVALKKCEPELLCTLVDLFNMSERILFSRLIRVSSTIPVFKSIGRILELKSVVNKSSFGGSTISEKFVRLFKDFASNRNKTYLERGKGGPKSPQKNRSLEFYKSVILLCVCVFFLIWNYWWSSNLLQKLHVWQKSDSWIMAQKLADQSGFFKQQYLLNKLSYEFDFLYVTRHQ